MKSYALAALLLSTISYADSSLHASLEAIRVKAQLPVLGAAVIQNGQLTQAAMTGVRKWGNPTSAQLEDKFVLGSCTKAMTATLVALFVEEGKIQWTSKLSELFPEIIRQDPAFHDVTVEMLLAHRGGLTGEIETYDDGALFKKLREPGLDPSEGRQLVAATLLTALPVNTPGSQYLYSNAGYIIVGRALEKLSGKSWETLMKERLFAPLEMSSCGFGPPGSADASAAPDQPWPHVLGSTGPIPIPPRPLSDNPSALGPAGTVHCSMADWGKFLSLHLDGFNHRPTKIVVQSSFEKLHTSYPGQDYTYGGWIRLTRGWAGGAVLTHEGTNNYNRVAVWLAPLQNRALVSVTNIATVDSQNALASSLLSLIQLP
jgi:CubicO group peptidase (beta-lactamase class C family)